MTTDNTDALRIVSKFVGAHNSSLDVCEFGELCDAFIEEARAVIAASPQAPAAQPVAWRFNGMEGADAAPIWHYSQVRPEVSAFAVQPLYVAPPRAVEPLTDDEIVRATAHCGVSQYTAISIVRAAERAAMARAHGIGKQEGK